MGKNNKRKPEENDFLDKVAYKKIGIDLLNAADSSVKLKHFQCEVNLPSENRLKAEFRIKKYSKPNNCPYQ